MKRKEKVIREKDIRIRKDTMLDVHVPIMLESSSGYSCQDYAHFAAGALLTGTEHRTN